MTQSGTITTTGANSIGIFAQSQGPENNDVVDRDRQRRGHRRLGSGSGVWIAAGVNNVLTVNAGGSVSAASGTAIRYDGDSSTVLRQPADGQQLRHDLRQTSCW